MTGPIPTGSLCDRYASVYTGAVADILDDKGYRDQTIRADISPLEQGVSMAGIAFTAVGRRNTDVDPDEQIRRHLRMVGEAPEHGVLVIETNDSVSAQIGELMTTSLLGQACRGCVCDGGTRDTPFIRDQGFPVFTKYQTPEDSVPRWELLDWDVEIIIGGVTVSPGDIVVGDDDGVVVIPKSMAEEVIVAVEKKTGDEDQVRTAIRDGATPLEAYDEYGVF